MPLVVLALLVGCASDDDIARVEDAPPAVPAVPAPTLDRRLVGDWRTKPKLGQLGVTVLRYSFYADGTFDSEVELRSMKLPEPLKAKGTYRTEGEQIRFRSTSNVGQGERSQSSTYRFDGTDLILVERDGDEFVLERQ